MQDGIGNGNVVLKMIEARLNKLDESVETGFREIREERSKTVLAIATLDTRVSLAERELDYRPCDEHEAAIKKASDQIQEVADQVRSKLAWRPMLVAVSVGVIAFLVSRWGGRLFL